MNARLNGILTTLAQQYTYQLVQRAPNNEARLKFLADGLANHGYLVILADIPVNSYDMLLRTWIDCYRRLYGVIVGVLFPAYTSVNIAAADAMRPPVIVIQGESAAVIQAIADYVVPYVAIRQRTHTISDAEIIGVMHYILDELEADELTRRDYDHLLRQSAQIILQLVQLPIQQYSLTVMKKPLFQQDTTRPTNLPRQKPRPVPPKVMPETGNLNPKTVDDHQKNQQKKKPDQDKTQPMPNWFFLEDDLDRTKPQPPVPWDPKEED